jgi:indole-3-acetate monooxygenase
MIGTVAQLFCTRLPGATFDRIFRAKADSLVVGVGAPAGRAEGIDGGYRVSGRWPFASGCLNAQWIGGHFVIHKDDAPIISDGRPLTRFVMLPAEQWRIEETWQASGLTGSGSHHVVLDNVTVPEAETFDLFQGPSCVPGPFAGTIMPFVGSLHAAVARALRPGRSPTSSPWPAAASFSPPPISGTCPSSSMNLAGSVQGCGRR